jgi:hypothetical protein
MYVADSESTDKPADPVMQSGYGYNPGLHARHPDR